MSARRALVLFLLASALSPVSGRGDEDELAACTAQLAADPDSEESAKCFHQAGQGPGAQEPAIRRLEELRTRYPGRPWLIYYLGHLRWTEPEKSEKLFQEAAGLFAARGDARGEILSRDSRERVLMQLGRSGEADREVARAVQVAGTAADPSLVLRAQLLESRHLLSQKRDVERAYFLARRAEAAAFPGAAYSLQRDCLLLLGNISLELGKIHEARDAFRRLARLANGFGDRFAEATASYSLTRSLTDEIAEMPSEGIRREALASARQALAAAEAVGHKSVAAKANFILGMLSPGPEARQHLERCAEVAAAPAEKSYCLELLARRVAAQDPARAAVLVDQAFALASGSADPDGLTAAWRERMRTAWRTAPPESAAVESQSALWMIEALRESRNGAARSPERFAAGSDDYYWLSGRLLGSGRLDAAFEVTERMRSRALLGALEAARARPAETAAAVHLRERRAATLGGIAGVQRRLLDPGVPPWEKAEARHELERLELEEADLRHQLSQANPALSSLLRPELASLAQLRRSLAPGEALLSFQVAPWKDLTGDFGGGSWLLAATRDAPPRVYRLIDRMELRPAVSLFTGLFEARNGTEAASCAGLYRALLAPALRDLPPGVRRLVIIPDDALHRLPFGALRESPKARPLALRYEISVVPSATLWLRWKENRPRAAPIPALAFADPPLPGGDEGPRPAPARERAAAVFTSGVRLGPLPYAREESRAVVRDLGDGSVRRLGEEASEAFLKGNPLRNYGILHFATHAVTDETNPDRSGVLLAPGDANQDGLLQIREIVDLDLEGRVVVLSACSSNTGALLRGEGVMSLARAFFQAGAHTVVASLWRLRDDEAADLFDRFYRHLGRGASVAGALQAAQRDLIAEGAPAAAWAGLVVLGDGDMVPLPGGRKGIVVPLWAWVLGGTGALLGLATVWKLYNRRRQTSA
ncbi:MAG TPA: CHAT domain-containing protein [Thermoanaerobaculia bacterium]|jgi:CHAT domain-containing protein|nr:CHAT domain-containing protein [Thermoanaerobaculia bacterium]